MRIRRRTRKTGILAVVHLTTVHSSNDVRILERECRSLAATGRYSVTLAAHGSTPQVPGVRHLRLPQPPANRFARMAMSQVTGLWAALKARADIWHIHDPELLLIAILLRRLGRTVIWDAHEDYFGQFDLHSRDAKTWVPSWARSCVNAGMPRLLRLADNTMSAVIAATSTVAGKYSNDKVVVVGNEARIEDFLDCKPRFQNRQILFNGIVGSSHCFEEVVQAVLRIEGITLAVAGRRPEASLWARSRAALGSRLVHLGWLDRMQLASAMEKSVLGLVTYSDTEAYATADSTKLFEFAAAGLPVVCTPNAVISSRVGQSGIGTLAAGFDAESIHRALCESLSDEDAWRARAGNARAWAAERGDWRSSEARLVQLYDDLAFSA